MCSFEESKRIKTLLQTETQTAIDHLNFWVFNKIFSTSTGTVCLYFACGKLD